jgi:tRNA isopentenyl-2-thiomethyl-A-37 hydroxylase MiaE
MSDKLNINNEMAQLDRKNAKFYDELTDEERKKFSTYLMLRWSSQVQADSNIQAYYVMSCNQNLNKNFFDIAKHPK